ncbi:hypothetical protein ACWGIV_34010, partial [Streptomyces sp. NPDC054844]
MRVRHRGTGNGGHPGVQNSAGRPPLPRRPRLRPGGGRRSRAPVGERIMSGGQKQRIVALREALATRVVVADGAMGTMLQAQNPSLDDL